MKEKQSYQLQTAECRILRLPNLISFLTKERTHLSMTLPLFLSLEPELRIKKRRLSIPLFYDTKQKHDYIMKQVCSYIGISKPLRKLSYWGR
jgi:hypothetical protein